MATDTATFPDETRRRKRTDGIGGDWYQYEFDNGYGASVIRNRFSYGGPEGKYELAVTHGGPLCYATPITSDVLGWLDESETQASLDEIAALPVNAKCEHSSV